MERETFFKLKVNEKKPLSSVFTDKKEFGPESPTSSIGKHRYSNSDLDSIPEEREKEEN